MAGDSAAPHIGSLIRRLRAERGLRLEDLARRAGYTKGFLSKIENGHASPPIATLLRVAQALPADPAVFFSAAKQAETGAGAAVLVKPAARSKALNEGSGPGYEYWSLAAPRLQKTMEPFLLTVRPEEVDPKRNFEHPGEEFLFVLKGRMDYRVGGELFAMEPGDSLYFNASAPHAPLPRGGPVTFLAIFCAPPRRTPARKTPKRTRR